MAKLTKNLLLIVFLIVISIPQQVKAQSFTIEILGGNVLNGIIEGAVLGGASMALADSKDPGPMRVGVGIGILYGIGVGIHDVGKAEGQKLLVKGSFNNGNNSTIIVLLDTGYGAAAGAVLATAGMLVANKPLIDGVQYGAAFGAFAGFGFGIFDAFVLAEHTPSPLVFKEPSNVDGLFTLTSTDKKLGLGLISPSVVSTMDFSANSITQNFDLGFNAVNLNISF